MKLTILSYGGGQDSTALLYKYIYDAGFRAQYAPEDFLVIMADTGNEHYETMDHVEYTRTLCAAHGIKFVHITPDMGHHRGEWTSLTNAYRAYNQVGSKAFSKTCTSRLKLTVMANFIEHYLEENYDIPKIRNKKGASYKQAFYQFEKKYGKITRMVGLSAGEEGRVATGKETCVWAKKTTIPSYPLIEMGMGRKECQEYIASVGHEVPMPSNCMFCPWMNEIELLWLFRNYPARYQEWVEIEKNKMDHFTGTGPNHGVWPKRSLPEVLQDAISEHGHMSDAELQEYKMSHGHCIKAKY